MITMRSQLIELIEQGAIPEEKIGDALKATKISPDSKSWSTFINNLLLWLGGLALAFAGTNRVLLGLGIVSLLFYISSYYYLLDATLLDKSQSLFIVGLVLLIIRWLMLHILPVKKGA